MGAHAAAAVALEEELELEAREVGGGFRGTNTGGIRSTLRTKKVNIPV